MPIVSFQALPSYARLKACGVSVVESAINMPILRVAFVNLMPGSSLEATERQFFSLLAESNPFRACYVYPVALDTVVRDASAQAHVQSYYYKWRDMQEITLDAVIITGANISHQNIAQEPFWQELLSVIEDIARRNLPCLFSCLAVHALLWSRYQQPRAPLARKLWGVFTHSVVTAHSLLYGINSQFTVPHSRFNDITAKQFDAAGFVPLIVSEEAGVHLAVDRSARWLCMQGHPEYDAISLLKEYKREIHAYYHDTRDNYPEVPRYYLPLQAREICAEYREYVEAAKTQRQTVPPFPEQFIMQKVDYSWHDTAVVIMCRWMQLISNRCDKSLQ